LFLIYRSVQKQNYYKVTSDFIICGQVVSLMHCQRGQRIITYRLSA